MRSLDNLCPGCFSEKAAAVVCPGCGCDESLTRSRLFLPYRTVLHRQYVIGRGLGNPGSFGITYLAWDLHLDTPVAVKEFAPRALVERGEDGATVRPISAVDAERYREGLRLFLQEARVLARLDHSNVVRVRTFFEENSTAYIVMDYVRGASLAERLAQCGGRMEQRQALGILLSALDGLGEVHAKGFLHRDVNPWNICLRQDGAPVLLDFGAARQSMGEQTGSPSVIFTPGFAAFEQYHSKGTVGPWTDVYGAAATLYYLLTGITPPDALERHMNDELAPPLRTDPRIPASLSRVIVESLSMDQKRRPQSATEFARMLRQAIPSASSLASRKDPSSSTAGLDTARPRHRLGRRSITLLFCSVMLAGAAAYLAYTRFAVRGGRNAPRASNAPTQNRPAGEGRDTTAPALHSGTADTATAQHVGRHKPGDIWIDPATGTTLAWIPPGSFTMGSNDYPDEKPVHMVTIPYGFWMQTTEVTQGQWKKAMATSPWLLFSLDWMLQSEDAPAVQVTFNDAIQYAKWLNALGGKGYRLPSEAEWEYACRAGSLGRYSFGDDESILGRYEWYEENAASAGEKYAHVVGGKLPNAWGLFDMHGNALEWCSDWYHPNYASAPADGSSWDSPKTSMRVLRGGSVAKSASNCRAANRGSECPEVRRAMIGFRVVRAD
ncbi:MAG: bifunctional serine/threonine-protein kinase/formylglycine-generating enzyme family protein [Acidobacteriota bacterium]